ncbi:hypothetical protein Lser_V15G29999 [Lactuca serriola]
MEAFLEEFQYLKIRLEAIKSATGNFDNNNVIVKGGFGKVYKGVLSHSKGQSTVAFKRLDRNYGQGDSEFLKEILMLSCYTHQNLISLVGFCDEDGEKILVYEHASHGSLDRHLSITTLTWRQRLTICLGAAMGLCYLHDPKETQQRVIHRDIKSSNILLDEDWNAKLSDLGLSKIGPANQQHTFLATNVAGTFGYIDPMYAEKSILTKESDVYSFGVVLFEVLCGKLCFENQNGHLQSLVQKWKQSYEDKKLDEIIFHDLKQHMDLSSLETLSDIAYRCLHKSGEERPKMSEVVEKLEIALRFQVISEEAEPQMDYEEISKNAVPPLIYSSSEELTMLLSKGILVNEGKTWFWLNKNGENCEMISPIGSLIPIDPASPEDYCRKKSRFAVEYYAPFCLEFRTHVKTQFLSPHITYTINLVFSLDDSTKDNLGFTYKLAGQTQSSTSYFSDKREDGWLMAELYQFTSDHTRNVDLEITFECPCAIAVEGIEFQPLESVEHQLLEDEEVDIPTVSDSDTYWTDKLPSDYEDIIKWSKGSQQWKTNKELYYILVKGFPIKDGKEWFSLDKNGRKCHVLRAKEALQKAEWRWQSLPESRFGKVAFGERHGFQIICISNILSPQTKYGSFLVYKVQEKRSAPWLSVKVHISCRYGYPHHSRYTYLVGPQTPILRPMNYQNTHTPLNRPKMEGLPRLRNDGWMEVQVWEFQTDSRGWISENLQLTVFDKSSLVGLIVEGIEFKPI